MHGPSVGNSCSFCRPAGADEYGFSASEAEPWSSPDGSAVDPWSCLRGCDKDSSCLAIFTTKLSDAWSFWMIEGGIGLGYTAGSVKVQPTQINAYLWAWTATTAATDSAGVSKPVVVLPPATPASGRCCGGLLWQQKSGPLSAASMLCMPLTPN